MNVLQGLRRLLQHVLECLANPPHDFPSAGHVFPGSDRARGLYGMQGDEIEGTFPGAFRHASGSFTGPLAMSAALATSPAAPAAGIEHARAKPNTVRAPALRIVFAFMSTPPVL